MTLRSEIARIQESFQSMWHSLDTPVRLQPMLVLVCVRLSYVILIFLKSLQDILPVVPAFPISPYFDE